MPVELIRRAARRLDRTVGVGVEETMLFEMPLGAWLAELPVSGVEIREMASEDVPAYCDASQTDRQAVIDRWSARDKAYVAYVDGRLAHYSWVRSEGVQPIYEADVSVRVAPGHFWIYHCWTAGWARGRRIYPAVLIRIAREYLEGGYTCAHIYTTRRNVASQNGIKRAGFTYTSSRRALRVGSRWFKWPGS
jgi:hypothetical protein